MAQSPRRQAPACYKLRVDGQLDDHWSAWFDDLTLTHESDGTTSLSGLVSDQAQLHGLLMKVRDLGVTLISVAVIDPSDSADHEPDSAHDQKVFGEHRTHEAGATDYERETGRGLALSPRCRPGVRGTAAGAVDGAQRREGGSR
jgi:hypothetical protein